ncbi:hypothetical protein [Geomonas azotofigens]|nr:hypothetical protein [Geomonas azotofigens]
MSRARITLYSCIAAVTLIIAYYLLTPEPLPDWPVNLVHFLLKH